MSAKKTAQLPSNYSGAQDVVMMDCAAVLIRSRLAMLIIKPRMIAAVTAAFFRPDTTRIDPHPQFESNMRSEPDRRLAEAPKSAVSPRGCGVADPSQHSMKIERVSYLVGVRCTIGDALLSAVAMSPH